MTDQAYQDYLPFEKRSGPKSIVYFTRDLSSEGLLKIFGKVQNVLSGKVAIKLHTGEPHGPNIIPAAWVKELVINALRIPQSLRPIHITKATVTLRKNIWKR